VMVNGRMASQDGPIKTFPLRGVKDSPPYLHDDRLLTLDDSVEFFNLVLGTKLTAEDKSDLVAFMHGIHGSDHHLLALVRSEGPGLHHSSWEVPSVHEVGLGAMQMSESGFIEGWGLGRHVLGSNYFHYVRDPWNSYCEYSCDMDYIPRGTQWQAADHKAEDAFYVWGPPPPKDFAFNYELVMNATRVS